MVSSQSLQGCSTTWMEKIWVATIYDVYFSVLFNWFAKTNFIGLVVVPWITCHLSSILNSIKRFLKSHTIGLRFVIHCISRTLSIRKPHVCLKFFPFHIPSNLAAHYRARDLCVIRHYYKERINLMNNTSSSFSDY